MKSSSNVEPIKIYVDVDPGICGFKCAIEAWRIEKRIVSVKITGTDCENIRRMSELIEDFGLRDLFIPIAKNPVFEWAARAGCHPSCAVPIAILKAVEAAMDMAIPKGVNISFKREEEEKRW